MASLVSIITPTFNSAPYIAETIQSVQNQTYQHWELIIVDDGSSDETVSIIQQIQKTEHRIQLVIQPKNVGPAVTRNNGISLAQGKYLTFLDADDLWFSDFIQNSINTIEKTKIPFVFSSYRRTDEALNFIYSDFIVPQKVTYSDILKTNSISCLTAFLDIEVL
jgi:glycosyltransferase involved in cell wall biosynthesis